MVNLAGSRCFARFRKNILILTKPRANAQRVVKSVVIPSRVASHACSRAPVPFWNAPWCFVMWGCSLSVRLGSQTIVYSFPRHEINEIGLYSLISSEGRECFGMYFTSTSVMCSGVVLDVHMAVNRRRRGSTIPVPAHAIIQLVSPSLPGAFRSFWLFTLPITHYTTNSHRLN